MKTSFKNNYLYIDGKNTFIIPRICPDGGMWSIDPQQTDKLNDFFMKNNMVKESILLTQKGVIGK